MSYCLTLTGWWMNIESYISPPPQKETSPLQILWTSRSPLKEIVVWSSRGWDSSRRAFRKNASSSYIFYSLVALVRMCAPAQMVVPGKCIFTGIKRIFYVRRASFVRMWLDKGKGAAHVRSPHKWSKKSKMRTDQKCHQESLLFFLSFSQQQILCIHIQTIVIRLYSRDSSGKIYAV